MDHGDTGTDLMLAGYKRQSLANAIGVFEVIAFEARLNAEEEVDVVGDRAADCRSQ